jgi:hypothetical protein
MKYKFVISFLFISFLSINRPPEPLVNGETRIVPIIENEELGPKYWYIRTIKLYYKDKLPRGIELRKGPPVNSYCSDETDLTFYSNSDSLTVKSYKRLSCEILAIYNLSEKDSDWLKSHLVYRIKIHNIITENKYYVNIDNVSYFKNLFTKYNVNY